MNFESEKYTSREVKNVIFLSSGLSLDIVIDNGRSNARKLLHINQCKLNELQKMAMVGVQGFSGCDQNSSFFRKGKKKCCKVAQTFLWAFSRLGTSYEIDERVYSELAAIVYNLHCGKKKPNQLRSNIFWRVLKTKNRIIHLSLLPPCRMSLELHIKTDQQTIKGNY